MSCVCVSPRCSMGTWSRMMLPALWLPGVLHGNGIFLWRNWNSRVLEKEGWGQLSPGRGFTVKLLYEGYQVHRYLRLYKISGLRLHLWRDSIVAIPLEQLVTGRLGNKQPRPEGWRINHDPMLSDIIEHHDLRNWPHKATTMVSKYMILGAYYVVVGVTWVRVDHGPNISRCSQRSTSSYEVYNTSLAKFLNHF